MRYENGKYRCENPKCNNKLNVDHVTLITTCHVRRFCSVECIAESQQEHIKDLLGVNNEKTDS